MLPNKNNIYIYIIRLARLTLSKTYLTSGLVHTKIIDPWPFKIKATKYILIEGELYKRSPHLSQSQMSQGIWSTMNSLRSAFQRVRRSFWWVNPSSSNSSPMILLANSQARCRKLFQTLCNAKNLHLCSYNLHIGYNPL